MIYSYKCINKLCSNNAGFEVYAAMRDSNPKPCELCSSECIRVYKKVSVELNFKDSYNSTRK